MRGPDVRHKHVSDRRKATILKEGEAMTQKKMRAEAVPQPRERVNCPYCGKPTPVALPADYAPVYRSCQVCGQRFIIERTRRGLDVFTIEAAPCCSNPDCRATETAHGQED